MLKNLKKTIFFFCLVCCQMQSFGQKGSNSPFSRFGIGDFKDNNLLHVKSMGGLDAAFTDVYYTNLKNPASYAFQRVVTFDLGVNMKYASLSDPNTKQGIWSGNLDYISLTLPLSNPLNELLEVDKKQLWMSMNFHLTEYSDVNYNITTTEDIQSVGEVEKIFAGRGGSYKVSWGPSLKYKGFAFGANLGFVFGQITNERDTRFLDQEFSFDNRFINQYNMSGFLYNVGAIYQYHINKKDLEEKKNVPMRVLNIGIYGNSNTSFSTTSNVINASLLPLGVNQIYQDTAFIATNVEGAGTLPSELGIGAMYNNGDQLALGANFTLKNWSAYKNDARPEELSNTYKITFGGYYRPNFRSFKYTDRMFYRFGVFYSQDPRTLNTNKLNNYGITLGTGLPVVNQRKISYLNLGLTIGRRGNVEVLRENYIEFGIGFTFNDDEWFLKRKYN